MKRPDYDLTPLRQQKLRYLFRILDTNNSGRIDNYDVQKFVDALAETRNYPKDSLAYGALKHAYMYIWERLSKQMDLNSDQKISDHEWLTFFADACSSDSFHTDFVQPIERAMVSMLDVDGDNRVRLVDYRMLARALKLNAGEVEQVFGMMDTNRDGELSREEAREAITDFFMSDDEDATGNWFFGDYRR